MKSSKTFALSLVAILGVFLFAHSGLSAQVSESIAGRVTDASGAALPGVNITVTSDETGAVRTAVSDFTGAYLVLSLPVGHYDVKADKEGFRSAIEKNLNLVVGQQAIVNLSLVLGEMQQSVTVTAEAPVVNTTTSSIVGLVSEQEIKDLPLNGRSFDNLITLNTGAINYTSFSSTAGVGDGPGSMFDVAGRRYEENLFLFNGVEYTGESNRSDQPGGVSGELLGIDAVREFNVLTDTYSAEYGKRPGAQIVVVTQSGSNQLHGTAFEFLRNSHLDARNYFDASPANIGHRLPEFQRNQFGGALGGPIKTDKAFFFVNYEGFRQRLGLSDLGIVPDNNARLGILNGTKVANLNAGMLPFFSLWPVANGTNLGGGLALNFSDPKESIREDFSTVRFDQNLSPKDVLSEAYTVDDGHSIVPQPDPLFIAIYKIRNQVGSIQEVHIFSTNEINTFRFGYSRGAFNFNVPPATTVPSSLTLVAGLEEGNITIGGGTSQSQSGLTTVEGIGSPSDYIQGARNFFTWSDDFQLIKGKHQISIGAWLQRLEDNRQGAGRKAGGASFSSLTTFLQGTVSTLQASPNPHEIGYRLTMGAWYVEDTIKLNSRLVLNAGLRYEFNNTLSGANGIIANGVFDSSGFFETNPLVGNIFPQNYDKSLLDPRIGLAWDVFGTGKTAVRAGFGIFRSLLDNQLWFMDQVAPFNETVTYGATSNVAFLPLIPIPRGTLAEPLCNVGVPQPCSVIAQRAVQNDKDTAVQEWNLSIEQQLTTNTSLRVEYAGSQGYHEPLTAEFNTLKPQICSNAGGCVSGGLNKTTATVQQGTLYVAPATALPNPFLAASGVIGSYNSNYNALQVDLKHRFSKGLQFRANYTWSKNMNIASEVGSTESGNSGPSLMIPYDPKADWGPSSSDATNQGSISGNYELPFGKGKPWLGSAQGAADKVVSGWHVESIVTLLSGFPFQVLANQNESGNGDSNHPDRVSWNPSFSGPVITGNPLQYYNPSAFMIPASGTWGNVSKGALRGPGLSEWDMSLLKDTVITERTKLEFRAEIFNLLNHTNFSFPNEAVFSGTAVSPTAGLITKTATTSRQIQFGLKLLF